MDNVSLRCFERGAEIIAEFLRPTFLMSEIEGDKLVGYMEGHGYLLGHRDGKLYRGDLHSPSRSLVNSGDPHSGIYSCPFHA